MTLDHFLITGYNKELAEHIVEAFKDIRDNYVLRKWKPSELDAGHFVEVVRRTLDFVLTGKYKLFGQQLAPFTDAELVRYENLPGPDSCRMLIPRVLKSIYNIRSKRGVAHISNINPNEMDATYILYSVKWVLAELVRMKSHLSPEQTQQMVDEIIERQIPAIWKKDDIEVVLAPKMLVRDQVLILLYEESPRKVEDLSHIIGYKNKTNFKKVLRNLHKIKCIYLSPEEVCHLLPPGTIRAESIIAEQKSVTK